MKKIKQSLSRWRQRRRDGRSIPVVSLPYQQEVEKIQKKWFFGFLILSLLAAWYFYQYSQQKVKTEELLPVFFSLQNLEAPAKVDLNNFVIKKIPAKFIPEGALQLKEGETFESKTLVQDINQNQILTFRNFQQNADPESISSSFQDQFAFSLDEAWLASRLPDIKKNDYIDIVTTNPDEDIESTKVVAHHLQVLDIVEPKNKKRTIILNVSEEDAKLILFAHGLKLPMQVLIYSSQENSTDN